MKSFSDFYFPAPPPPGDGGSGERYLYKPTFGLCSMLALSHANAWNRETLYRSSSMHCSDVLLCSVLFRVCVCVFIYVLLSLCVFIYVLLSLCVCARARAPRLRVWLSISLCVVVYLSVSGCLSLCVWLSISLCVVVYLSVCGCLSLCVCGCLSLCVWLSISLCVYVSMCRWPTHVRDGPTPRHGPRLG